MGCIFIYAAEQMALKSTQTTSKWLPFQASSFLMLKSQSLLVIHLHKPS